MTLMPVNGDFRVAAARVLLVAVMLVLMGSRAAANHPPDLLHGTAPAEKDYFYATDGDHDTHCQFLSMPSVTQMNWYLPQPVDVTAYTFHASLSRVEIRLWQGDELVLWSPKPGAHYRNC